MTPFVLCGACLELRGPITTDVRQLCGCATAAEHAAQRSIGDHNTVLELCRCCALEPLPSGGRWSRWFCDPCSKRVLALNQRSGRCVVPIGRHSLMNGVFFDPGADAAVVAFAGQLGALFDAMGGTTGWRRTAVRMNLAAVGPHTGQDLDLGAYVEAVEVLAPLKEQRFDEMVAALSRPAHPSGTEPVATPSSAEHLAEGDRR